MNGEEKNYAISSWHSFWDLCEYKTKKTYDQNSCYVIKVTLLYCFSWSLGKTHFICLKIIVCFLSDPEAKPGGGRG